MLSDVALIVKLIHVLQENVEGQLAVVVTHEDLLDIDVNYQFEKVLVFPVGRPVESRVSSVYAFSILLSFCGEAEVVCACRQNFLRLRVTPNAQKSGHNLVSLCSPCFGQRAAV